MKTSPSIGNIGGGLAKARRKFKAAIKDSTNPHYRSLYAGLPAVSDACADPLASEEIAVLQSAMADGTVVSMVTLLVHSSGEWIESDPLSVQAKDAGPQAIGSCITYLRRYQLAAMVGVVADDDDAEAASGRSTGLVVDAPRPAPNRVDAIATQKIDVTTYGDAKRIYMESPLDIPGAAHPDGSVLITKVEQGDGTVRGWIHTSGMDGHNGQSGAGLPFYRQQLRPLAEEVCQLQQRVRLEVAESANGKRYVKAIHRVLANEVGKPPSEPVDVTGIPF